ncbi:cell division cycle protein 48-like, partial [Trifolium medium]|nr:cell division cycle protein 48-like [Trifolium medium]
EAMDKDLVEDEVAEIKAAHFEESMKYARRTVRTTGCDPTLLQQLLPRWWGR